METPDEIIETSSLCCVLKYSRNSTSVRSRPKLTSKRSQRLHSIPVAPALFFGAAIGSEKLKTTGSARSVLGSGEEVGVKVEGWGWGVGAGAGVRV